MVTVLANAFELLRPARSNSSGAHRFPHLRIGMLANCALRVVAKPIDERCSSQSPAPAVPSFEGENIGLAGSQTDPQMSSPEIVRVFEQWSASWRADVLLALTDAGILGPSQHFRVASLASVDDEGFIIALCHHLRAYFALCSHTDTDRGPTSNEARRVNPLLSSVGRALGALLENARTSDALRAVAGAINNITHSDANKQVFCTELWRNRFLTSMDIARSPECVHWLCCALNNITSAEGSRCVYATPTFLDAMVVKLGEHATTPASVTWLSCVLANVTSESPLDDVSEIPRSPSVGYRHDQEQDDAAVPSPMAHDGSRCDESRVESVSYGSSASTVSRRLVRCSDDVRNTLIRMTHFATTEESVRSLCGALCNFTHAADGQSHFGTPLMVEGVARMAALVRTPECASWVSSLLCNLTSLDSNLHLFDGARTCDMLVQLAAVSTSADSVEWLCCAMCNCSCDQRIESPLRSEVVRDALAVMAPHAITPSAARWWCGFICNITRDDQQVRRVYGDDAIRKGFIKIASQCESHTPESVFWWCSAVLSVGGCHLNRHRFNTPEVLLAVQRMRQWATTAESRNRAESCAAALAKTA
jgi:hypothetical protein